MRTLADEKRARGIIPSPGDDLVGVIDDCTPEEVDPFEHAVRSIAYRIIYPEDRVATFLRAAVAKGLSLEDAGKIAMAQSEAGIPIHVP